MCDCYDSPKIFGETPRKARKQHKCCECDRNIAKGEEYVLMQGLWDDGWSNYKCCKSCHKIGQAYMQYSECCYNLGELFQELKYSEILEDTREDDDEPNCWITHVDWLEIKNQSPLELIAL